MTTVYRELEFLRQQGILVPVSFADGVQRYESAELEHHHHLICIQCNAIEDVHIEHGELDKAEKVIAKTTGFEVFQHSLEFYGHCRKCQKA